MKTGVEMLPCPMCGGRADTGGHTGTIYVECQVCGVLGSCAIDEDGAIVAWNTRQTHPAATGSVREAVDDEDKIADMIGFGASETAPYLYPEPDQQLVRAAYCEGAAQGARALLRWQADALAAALTPDAAASDAAVPAGGEYDEGGRSADDAVDFVFDRLAQKLGLAEWQVVEGSEEWEGDVSATLHRLLIDAGIIDDETGAIAMLAAAPKVASIPAGMKAWNGGDSAPTDYGGSVQLRRGDVEQHVDAETWCWTHSGELDDIVAYTPKVASDTDAAASEAGEVWQDIASAPRDGTPFIATLIVHNLSGQRWWETHVIWADDETGEVASECEAGWTRVDDYSHWMPMPAPPAALTTQGGAEG